ncbi:MAG: hypothetical protein IKP25_01070 [Ruminococcus sp.]|nr:hypothetical protein [Ruminococcus sp.]
MSKSKKKNVLIFSILFVMAIMLAFYYYGVTMAWGVKKKTVTFKNLNTSDQIMLNDSLQKVTGKSLTIEKMTRNEYKNGVKNYVITFNESEKLEIESQYFYELNEEFADSNSNTGYYYKKNKLYIIIGDKDYTRITDEKEKEILKALGELSDALSKVFEKN